MFKRKERARIPVPEPFFDSVKHNGLMELRFICIEKGAVFCFQFGASRNNDGTAVMSFEIELDDFRDLIKRLDDIELFDGKRSMHFQNERVYMVPAFVFPTSDSPQCTFHYLA